MSSTTLYARPASPPVFVTQQRKLRDFLRDQNPIATISCDWLYAFAENTDLRQPHRWSAARAPARMAAPAAMA
jgi:hypothetical protein